MRTTLNIADDVLFAAQDFARRDKRTLGEVISDLARSSLQKKQTQRAASGKGKGKAASSQTAASKQLRELGFNPLPSRGGLVTNEMINALREQEGL